MSKEVDERVVEMKFNNAQFEKNVSKTMQSLKALSERLKFTGGEQGFEKISDAAGKVKFDKFQGVLEDISDRFSTMGVIGTTALMRITNQAIDTGERLVKSLSIDQVASGWTKYEQKTASVQTIMNATGKSIDKVNSYLDKLMWYSDETSYGFTDMTASLGQLTAAGGDIDKLIPMIMGIANATAYAGKGASEFSRVIYNLNQSYSQGYLNLMDWKSVELAGVATAELKQQIIDTAVEMGKLKKGEVTISTFGSTLSKKWADKSVMEAAFGKLAEFTMAIKDGVDSGTFKNAADGIEQLADQYDEATVKAFKAAQEAKSFSEAVDATKDAVSSGWLETFEIIFGNYDIAKGFWTDLTNELWELFASGKDLRNEIFSGAFDTGWTQLLKSGLSDVSDILENGLYTGFNSAGIITDEDIERTGSFGNALGDALRKGKISSDTLEKSLRGAASGYASMLDMSDAELKKLGYTREEVEKINNTFAKFFEKVDDGTISISELADKMSQMSGREHFFNGLLNILKGIESLLAPVKEAFNDILGPTSEGIYKALSTFDELTGKLQLSEETADKVQRVFTGFFSVIKMGLNVIHGIGSGVATVFKSLTPAADSLLTLAANIGDYFVKLGESSGITETFSTVLETLSHVMDKVSGAVKTVIDWFIELGAKTSVVFDPIRTVGGWIENFINFVGPKLEWLADRMGELFSELGNSAMSGFGDFNKNALWGFVNAGLATSIIAGIKGFIDGFKEIGSTIKDTVGSVAELLDTLGEAVTAWKTNKNAETLKTIAGSIAILAGSLVVLSLVKPERLAASIGAMTSLFIELIGATVLLTEFTKNNKGFGKGSNSMLIMAAAVLILSVALKKIGDIDSEKLLASVITLGVVMAELVAAQVAISKWAKDGAKHATSMLIMAAAVNVLASAVTQLANLEWEQIGKGLLAVGGLLAEIALFSVASNWGGLSVGKATGILVLSAALSVLQKAVAAFGEMSTDEIRNGLIALGALMAEIAVFNMLSNLANHVVSTAAALTILSGGLMILTQAMVTLGGMTLDQIGVALAALGGGLLEMVIALTLVKNSIGSAASFLIMAVALNALIIPLKALGEMQLSEIGHSLLALAGAVGVMVVGLMLLSPIGPIVIGVALALSLLAASLSALLMATAVSDFIDNLSAGLASLQTIRLEAFVNTLMTLGMAAGYFVAGLIVGLGKAIGSIATAISEIIVAICEAITAAAPAIGNTIIALITMICDVLITCLPKVEATLEALVTALCDVLINCTPKILETIDTVIGAIISYIGSKLGALGKWIVGKIQSAFTDEHGADIAEQNGEHIANGYSKGIENGTNGAVSAVEKLASAQDEAYRSYWGIASPSKLAAENAGYIVGGLNQGISDNMGAAETMMTTLADKMDGAFRDELGIHSNSDKGIEDGQFFVGGVGEGVANKADNLCEFMENLGDRAHNAFRNGFGLGKNSTGNAVTRTSAEIEKELESKVISPEYRQKLQDELKEAYAAEGKKADDIDWSSFWTSIVNPNGSSDDNKNPTGTTTNKNKTKSTGKKKTVAQQIEEKYKAKLEANKTQREILDNEYELWQEENQYSADIDTQMAKKAENAAAEIANQTERVTIAQQKYDEMTKRWGKDKQETKEAYNDLLEEKTSLAKLKAEQYTNLFEAATTRYDADLETLEKEYNLWSTQNDKTATKLDKLDRETQYQNDELAIKQKKVDNAKEQYETMRREYGESDLRTIEAHNDLLDAQAEALEIQNDLAHKELDRLDILIENIQTAQSRMQSRMDILSTVYDDGSLKEREDAYKQAVEEYGKDSKQAKKAQFQGTTSAILSTVTALKNLNYQMQQTKKYEEELSGMTPGTEEYDNKMSDILSSKSSFIGFASNLADALNMEDTGKKAMLILANSMQDHWKEIDTAMKNVMDKVTKGMSDGLKDTFKDVFDTMSSDEFAQMGTEFISTVTSALQGDWAGAVASAIAFAMDFAFSDTGKKIQSDMVKLFSDNVVPAIKNSVGSIDKLVNGEGGLVAILQNGSVLAGNALAGSGGITAALGSIGTTLTEVGGVLMGFLTEFWWVFLIIGAIAALIGGIAWYASSRKKKADNAASIGEEFDKEFSSGIEGNTDKVTDAVTDMTENAMDIAKGALSTISKVMDDEYDYTPQITPIVDLTEVTGSADELNNAFDATARAMSLDGDVSRKLASQIEAQAEIQNGLKASANNDTLNAINALGEHMDGVADSIKGMRMTIDGRKTIGYIDSRLGARAAMKAK